MGDCDEKMDPPYQQKAHANKMKRDKKTPPSHCPECKRAVPPVTDAKTQFNFTRNKCLACAKKETRKTDRRKTKPDEQHQVNDGLEVQDLQLALDEAQNIPVQNVPVVPDALLPAAAGPPAETAFDRTTEGVEHVIGMLQLLQRGAPPEQRQVLDPIVRGLNEAVQDWRMTAVVHLLNTDVLPMFDFSDPAFHRTRGPGRSDLVSQGARANGTRFTSTQTADRRFRGGQGGSDDEDDEGAVQKVLTPEEATAQTKVCAVLLLNYLNTRTLPASNKIRFARTLLITSNQRRNEVPRGKFSANSAASYYSRSLDGNMLLHLKGNHAVGSQKHGCFNAVAVFRQSRDRRFQCEMLHVDFAKSR